MSEDSHVHKKLRLDFPSMSRFVADPPRLDQYTPSENLPQPPGIAEFLENPNSYRPNEDFANNTFVEDETLLTHAIKLQNESAVDVLLKCGADLNLPNRKGLSPISVAAHKGYVPIMAMLIQRNVDVNAVNISGSTALIQASHFGHLAAVVLLLQHGANADFANNKGTTALMRACQEGHVDITRSLLSAQVDVNRKNHEGMNALMLASQRGHAEIVFLLIKAGAVMDEQTAQGSTALMLACKRGHEKCAEVLVSMGAEIFMRDRRNRTARETALKRDHTNLLCWLDTQVQIRRIQELKHKQRSSLLHELRKAYINDRLRLSPSETFLSNLFRAVTLVTHSANTHDMATLSAKSMRALGHTLESAQQLVSDFMQSSLSLSYISKSPERAMQCMQSVLRREQAQSLSDLENNTPSAFLTSYFPSKRVVDYADWQWPSLLLKCVELPGGVCELIMDFIPLPRVWQWSLLRLQRRCRLAPLQAMLDISILMDEILCDSLVVAGKDQKLLLVKIAHSPVLKHYLVNQLGMPVTLMESLCSWADVQSLLHRSNVSEVSFKWPLARRMLSVAVELYKWHKHRVNAVRWLDLTTPQALQSAAAEQDESQDPVASQSAHTDRGVGDGSEEGEELVAGTDAGGEEGSDLDMPIEAETENEFVQEAEVEGLLDDSENEDADTMNG